MASTGSRKDPYAGFRFRVEIGGDTFGGFSEVAGLDVETEVFEYKEGGENDFAHKFPTRVKQGNITLKRGIVDASLWRWYAAARPGTIDLRSGSIELQDPSGATVLTWTFDRAWPRKIHGPGLNAAQSSVAVESVEICHHGLELG